MATEDFSQFDISVEEKDRLVAEVIRYVLFKSQQSLGCPIKREELTQLVTKNYKQRSLPTFVINLAREKISSIFGYEMRELQRSRPSTNQGRHSQQSGPDAKSYVLVSKLPADVYKNFVEDANTSHLPGLAFVVMSVLHLEGGKLKEENFWHILGRMELSETNDSHPDFGNVKQVMESLVQQRYILKEKVNGPEGNTVVYELAERALDGPIIERVKEYILESVQKGAANADQE